MMDRSGSVAALRTFAARALGHEIAYEKVTVATLIMYAVRGAGGGEQEKLAEAIEGLLGHDGDGKQLYVDSKGEIGVLS